MYYSHNYPLRYKNMAKIGYARVSTIGQSLELQHEALLRGDCERIFEETKSGKSRKDRPVLEEMLRYLREGDVLVITRLDRLARSVHDLTVITNQLQTQSIDFVVLDQDIDTTTATGRLLFTVLGAIGEFERDLINQRTQEGIRLAREKGVKFGPKTKLDEDQIEQLKAEFKATKTSSRQELADKWGISKSSLYRLVK